MSMLYDTLKYNGTERPLGTPGWGFELYSCVSKRGNLKPDTFTGTIPQASISDDPVFPYEAAIIVQTNRVSASGADNTFSGGTIKFQGKRTKNPMRSTGKWVGVTYEFQGPWYDLDITQYLQTFKGQTTNFNPGENVLNTAAPPLISSGLKFISVGDQIQCVLQFVLDSYAALGLPVPFQYVGRDLDAGAINLRTTGVFTTRNQNTDAAGDTYVKSLNGGTTIDISLFKLWLKSDIIRPMSAAQVIQKLLEWSPRTNMAFDYSTTPPTVVFSNIDNAADVNLALFDGTVFKDVSLQRRDDLIPVSVVVGYRITNTVGGNTAIDYVIDKWGAHGSNSGADPSQGPGVVIQIMDLQGFSISFATGQLDCEPLACIGGSHAARRAWWASKRGGQLAKLEDLRARFQDETGAATSIPNAKIYYASAGVDSTGAAVAANQEFTAADYAFFVNHLFRGTQHAWMTLAGGAAVKSVKAKIVAPMQYAEYDATGASETDATGNVIHRHNATDQEHVNLELTNGVTGDYSAIASSTAGESYIIGQGGIAQYLWNMLSTPQYEGDFVKVEASFTGGVSLLSRVNLTGGRTEWTTMHAQIQDIAEYWGEKQTEIRIGVAKHLNADQLSALLNMSRYRRAWYNPLLKADNTVATAGEIQMPVTAGQANTVPGLSIPQQQAHTLYSVAPVGSTPGTVSGQINHDPKIIKDKLAATTPTPVAPFGTGDLKVMQPRECQFCDEAGNIVNAILHVTGFYTKP
jgi:hypothetical protein